MGLSICIKPEDIIEIGGNIQIQAVREGKKVRLYINAPKDILIARLKKEKKNDHPQQ